MGWRRPGGCRAAPRVGTEAIRAARRVSAAAVLAPLVPLVVVALAAASATIAALHVHAAVLRGGTWAWLGDVALALDVCGSVALLGFPAAVRRRQDVCSGIAGVDAMSGREFEDRLALLFADLGYSVTRTRTTGDFGADLLLERAAKRLGRTERTERAGDRAVVQAKRYDGKVGIDAVQQVIGATRYYEAAQAFVVTNSTCTPAAAALAEANGVELVERGALAALLAAHPLPAGRSSAALLLFREVLAGAALVLFVTSALARVAWRASRSALRLCTALWRGLS